MTREQGTGKRFWTTLLFVTYVGFFPFTYLSILSIDINLLIYCYFSRIFDNYRYSILEWGILIVKIVPIPT